MGIPRAPSRVGTPSPSPDRSLGHTLKGSYPPRGVLGTFWKPPSQNSFWKPPSQNPYYHKPIAGDLLRTLLRPLPQNPSQWNTVLPYDPMGVHPIQKTREGCGCFWGFLQEFWRKFPESRHALNSRISGHWERETCRKHWVHTALDLVPTFRAGCFAKSTVTALKERKKHPKKSNTKIFFCPPPPPPVKIFCVCISYLHFKQKTQPEHKEFRGLKAPKKGGFRHRILGEIFVFWMSFFPTVTAFSFFFLTSESCQAYVSPRAARARAPQQAQGGRWCPPATHPRLW